MSPQATAATILCCRLCEQRNMPGIRFSIHELGRVVKATTWLEEIWMGKVYLGVGRCLKCTRVRHELFDGLLADGLRLEAFYYNSVAYVPDSPLLFGNVTLEKAMHLARSAVPIWTIGGRTELSGESGPPPPRVTIPSAEATARARAHGAWSWTPNDGGQWMQHDLGAPSHGSVRGQSRPALPAQQPSTPAVPGAARSVAPASGARVTLPAALNTMHKAPPAQLGPPPAMAPEAAPPQIGSGRGGTAHPRGTSSSRSGRCHWVEKAAANRAQTEEAPRSTGAASGDIREATADTTLPAFAPPSAGPVPDVWPSARVVGGRVVPILPSCPSNVSVPGTAPPIGNCPPVAGRGMADTLIAPAPPATPGADAALGYESTSHSIAWALGPAVKGEGDETVSARLCILC